MVPPVAESWPLSEPVVEDSALSPAPRREVAVPRVSAPPAPLPTFPNADRRERLLESVPELTEQIERFMAADHIPGLAAGLVIDDELAWAAGFGVADQQTGQAVTPTTGFRIGSITKTITMSAILRLRDRGSLELDVPAVRYAPSLAAIGYPTDEVEGFTVRQLLTHTSGLPRSGSFTFEDPEHRVDRATIEASLGELELLVPPGSVRRYSNLGFTLLGLIIEDLTGEDHRAHIDRVILGPLGMHSTVWSADAVGAELAAPHDYHRGTIRPREPQEHGAASAAGGLYSTVEDMARYLRFQLRAWPPRSGAESGPLRRATVREAHEIHAQPWAVTSLSTTHYPHTVVGGTGLAWAVRDDCRLGHFVAKNGRSRGYTAALMFLPRRGVGIVLLANQYATDMAELGVALLEVLADDPALTDRRVPIDPAAEDAARELFTALREEDRARLGASLSAAAGEPEPLRSLVERWAEVRARVGACDPADDVEISDARVVVRAACARGRVRVEAVVGAQGLSRVKVVEPRASPPPQLREAARNVERLLARWDEALARETFVQSGRPSRYRAFFRGVTKARGRCRVASVVAATDRSAEFRLRCRYRSARLRLEASGERGSPIRGLWILDEPGDRHTCPSG